MKALDSAKALLTRADQHLAELEAEIETFGQRYGEGPFTSIDPSSGKTLFKFRLREPIPLLISCITFDVVNEIRSALDYAVFGASSAILRVPEPSGTKFPFGVDAADARGDFNRKNPPAGLDQLRDFIVDSIQPYQNGRNDALWRLNKLRNSKIHRQLSPAVASRGSFATGRGTLSNFSTVHRWDSGKQELTFLEADYASHDAEVQAALSVSFVERAQFPNDRVYGRLFLLTRDVRECIAEIEEETTKIIREG